jgi:hypothetical protein
MNKIKTIGLTIVSSVLPLLASAQALEKYGAIGGGSPASMAGSQTIGTGNVQTYVGNILNWVFYFFIVLAVVFILIAAFSYLTAGGDEQKITKAKNELIYAIIAIVIAVLAKSIVTLIAGIAGTSNVGLQ